VVYLLHMKVKGRRELEYAFAHADELYGKPGRYMDRWMIMALEKRGALRCRRVPHNNYRVFTDKEIEEIVRAFSPDGTGAGYWHYDED